MWLSNPFNAFRYVWFWTGDASRCCLVESGLTSECDDEHNKAHAHMRILWSSFFPACTLLTLYCALEKSFSKRRSGLRTGLAGSPEKYDLLLAGTHVSSKHWVHDWLTQKVVWILVCNLFVLLENFFRAQFMLCFYTPSSQALPDSSSLEPSFVY